MASPYLFLCLLIVGVYGDAVVWKSEVLLDDTNECEPYDRFSLSRALSRTIRRCIHRTSPTFPGFYFHHNLSQCLADTEAFCKSLPTMRQCVDEESSRWANCFAEYEHLSKLYIMFKDTVNATLEDLCIDNGAKLSRFWYSFRRNTTRDRGPANSFLWECLKKTSDRMDIAERSVANFPTKYWYIHKEIGKFKNCISEHLQADNETVNEAVQFMDRTLDSMNCPHPENESEVLCKDLDNAIDRMELCPLKAETERMVMLKLVQTGLGRCLDGYEAHTRIYSRASSSEEYGNFKLYCGRDSNIRHCISQTSSIAEVCLGDEAYDIYKLIRRKVDRIIVHGCHLHRPLARRLSRYYFDPDRSMNAMVDCLKQVHVERDQTMEGNATVHGSYYEFSVIKTCLLDVTDFTPH